MAKNGMPGGVNMNQLMQQAQEMQKKLEQAQENSKSIEVVASAGGGMVKVTATGDMRIKAIEIDPEAIDPEDVELIQDTIIAAVNDALTAASDAANREVAELTGLGAMGNGAMGFPF